MSNVLPALTTKPKQPIRQVKGSTNDSIDAYSNIPVNSSSYTDNTVQDGNASARGNASTARSNKTSRRQDHGGEGGTFARVVRGRKGSGDEELSLRVGDVVKVLSSKRTGYLKCEINDDIGYVPSSYLEFLDEPDEDQADRGEETPRSERKKKKKKHKDKEKHKAQDGDGSDPDEPPGEGRSPRKVHHERDVSHPTDTANTVGDNGEESPRKRKKKIKSTRNIEKWKMSQHLARVWKKKKSPMSAALGRTRKVERSGTTTVAKQVKVMTMSIGGDVVAIAAVKDVQSLGTVTVTRIQANQEAQMLALNGAGVVIEGAAVKMGNMRAISASQNIAERGAIEGITVDRKERTAGTVLIAAIGSDVIQPNKLQPLPVKLKQTTRIKISKTSRRKLPNSVFKMTSIRHQSTFLITPMSMQKIRAVQLWQQQLLQLHQKIVSPRSMMKVELRAVCTSNQARLELESK